MAEEKYICEKCRLADSKEECSKLIQVATDFDPMAYVEHIGEPLCELLQNNGFLTPIKFNDCWHAVERSGQEISGPNRSVKQIKDHITKMADRFKTTYKPIEDDLINQALCNGAKAFEKTATTGDAEMRREWEKLKRSYGL